jgi:hypothetical protein
VNRLFCNHCLKPWSGNHPDDCEVPELNDCPCCADAGPHVTETSTDEHDGYAVDCDACGLRGPIKATPLEAAVAFNKLESKDQP